MGIVCLQGFASESGGHRLRSSAANAGGRTAPGASRRNNSILRRVIHVTNSERPYVLFAKKESTKEKCLGFAKYYAQYKQTDKQSFFLTYLRFRKKRKQRGTGETGGLPRLMYSKVPKTVVFLGLPSFSKKAETEGDRRNGWFAETYV